MPKKNYVIPADVKQEILDKIKNNGLAVLKAAEQYGVSTKTIYSWLSRSAVAPPTIRALAKLKKENKALLELVGRLTVQLSVSEKKDGRWYY